VIVADDLEAESLTYELRLAGYTAVASIEHEARHRFSTVRLMSPSGVKVDLLFASSGIEVEIVETSPCRSRCRSPDDPSTLSPSAGPDLAPSEWRRRSQRTSTARPVVASARRQVLLGRGWLAVGGMGYDALSGRVRAPRSDRVTYRARPRGVMAGRCPGSERTAPQKASKKRGRR
jgi:hypothetical protein